MLRCLSWVVCGWLGVLLRTAGRCAGRGTAPGFADHGGAGAGRYRQLGAVGMVDRSSRPHRSPRRTPSRVERRIINIRVTRRWGPARTGYLLGVHPSTVHRVLTRFGLDRLRG
jgi:leucine-zipper of insertion element IS481